MLKKKSSHRKPFY